MVDTERHFPPKYTDIKEFRLFGIFEYYGFCRLQLS